MIKTALLFYFALSSVMISSSSFAVTEMPRPVFTKERQFLVQKAQPVTELSTPFSEIQVFVFNRALQSCGFSAATLQNKVNLLFTNGSPLWLGLNALFPDSLNQVRRNKVQIFIDDFSDFGAENPVFASYFLRKPLEAIGLDCSTRAQAYWLPSLAHELTHALLADRGTESWLEEGLAQMNERQLGGMQPEIALRSLNKAPAILNFRELRRPLPDQQSYALSFLFARYVHSVFGGWPTLRALIAPPQNSNYFDGIMANASAAAAQTSTMVAANKLTSAGIQRFFYVALAMKASADPRYTIPGWQGFSNLTLWPKSFEIKPGQAVIVPALGGEWNFQTLSQYEIYQVYEGSNGEDQITPITSPLIPTFPSFKVIRQFVLILNTQQP